jgi:hypothetical protein
MPSKLSYFIQSFKTVRHFLSTLSNDDNKYVTWGIRILIKLLNNKIKFNKYDQTD